VDCLTLLTSNLLLAGGTEESVLIEAQAIVEVARKAPFTTIVVSNEVGMGLVPTSDLGRVFRDVAGLVNQTVAAGADEAILMVSGLPVTLKAPKPPGGPPLWGTKR
jgi:adenosylcobinamide kinase/adenosylcobinamide-phosphate guanylyltransferase